MNAHTGSKFPGVNEADGRSKKPNAAGHPPAICVKQQRINRINRINCPSKKRLPKLAILDKACSSFYATFYTTYFDFSFCKSFSSCRHYFRFFFAS